MRKNLSFTRIKKAMPGFNERELTEEDFWKIAKRERIVVKEMWMPANGYWQRRRGRDYIILNKRLRGTYLWLHTAFHELVHYFLDTPLPSEEPTTLYRRRSPDPDDPRERLADAFALVAMIPFRRLEQLAGEDLTGDPELMNLAAQRVSVRADLGI